MNIYLNSLVIKEAKLNQQCNNTAHPKQQKRKGETKRGREGRKEGRKGGKRKKNEQIIPNIYKDLIN